MSYRNWEQTKINKKVGTNDMIILLKNSCWKCKIWFRTQATRSLYLINILAYIKLNCSGEKKRLLKKRIYYRTHSIQASLCFTFIHNFFLHQISGSHTFATILCSTSHVQVWQILTLLCLVCKWEELWYASAHTQTHIQCII